MIDKSPQKDKNIYLCPNTRKVVRESIEIKTCFCLREMNMVSKICLKTLESVNR